MNLLFFCFVFLLQITIPATRVQIKRMDGWMQITIKKLVEEDSLKKILVTSVAKWQCITQDNSHPCQD